MNWTCSSSSLLMRRLLARTGELTVNDVQNSDVLDADTGRSWRRKAKP